MSQRTLDGHEHQVAVRRPNVVPDVHFSVIMPNLSTVSEGTNLQKPNSYLIRSGLRFNCYVFLYAFWAINADYKIPRIHIQLRSKAPGDFEVLLSVVCGVNLNKVLAETTAKF